MTSRSLIICGVGALGSHAALFCRNLPVGIEVIDCDKVESKNLAAQAFVKSSLAKNKAAAIQLQLYNFYGIRVTPWLHQLSNTNINTTLGSDPKTHLLVDCFDNKASRELLSSYARKHGLPLVHAAIAGDGTFGIVRWDERFVADAEDVPGQATCEGGEALPMIALISATLARIIQDYLKTGTKRDAIVLLEQVLVTDQS